MGVELSFGTAGIRAPMGAGNRALNPGTVRAIASATLAYAAAEWPDSPANGICVAFDGRANSLEFAREVIGVALTQGYMVRAFHEPTPTPLLAFCTQLHGAALGIVITASHNPREDNGIKLYLRGGSQILAPHDGRIAERIASADPVAETTERTFEQARESGRLLRLGDDERKAYLHRVLTLVPNASTLPTPPFAYTATCGVGSALTHRLLERMNALGMHEVESQRRPRADFGGLRSPNPEHPEALRELVALADEIGLSLGFAHDPDADRLAALVRREGRMEPLTGDDLGALLGAFVLETLPADGPTPIVVSTLVSGGLLEAVAHERGARFERTYTGFKWIAERGRAVEAEGGGRFVFGYEEAIGYAFGALGDDKDGIAALYVALELARRLRARGQTLLDMLDALTRRHGVFASRQLTVQVPPETGREHITTLLRRVREAPPAEILAAPAERTDYLERPVPYDLVCFSDDRGTRICIRPSGTEPKLKVYLHAHEPVATHESVELARGRARARLDQLVASLDRLLRLGER